MDFSIFHDYDIRGVYPKEVNEEVYKLIGRALAAYIKKGPIAVGSDMRTSSPSLKKSLIEGIVDSGLDVVDLGMISTEMLYFASGKYHYKLSCIVSASHNPPQYNGLKAVEEGMKALNSNYGFPQIVSYLKRNRFKEKIRRGKVKKISIFNSWIHHLLSKIDPASFKKKTVVIDAGNGMAGLTWQGLASKLPLTIIPLYFKPDGTFPHHIPNPIDEANLEDIKHKIISSKADLGLAFDGDADRVFILDEKAQVLSGTITTAILAEHLLKKEGPSSILYNAICGRVVPETIKRYGGTGKRVRVGHSYIKKYMKEYDSLFAGEHSGHYYFRDNYYSDSSALAALYFLEYLSKGKRKVSDIRHQYDKYRQSGELNFRHDDIPEAIDHIKKAYQARAKSIDNLDGLSVWLDKWWFNIRASKTEPLLRLNIEADNLQILNQEKEKLIDKLTSLGAKLNIG